MRTMYRNWVSTAALMALGFIALGTGCRESGRLDGDMGGKKDGGHVDYDGGVGDLGGDMSMANTSIHALYVSSPPQGTPVVLTDVVVTGIATTNGKSSSGNCQYQAYVQDRTGSVPPMGVHLYAKGAMCTQPDGGASCTCPYPPDTGTPLDALDDSSKLGAVATVHGYWMPYTPRATDAGAQPTQNELTVTSIDLTGDTAAVAPLVVADPAQFAYNGQGFIDYESTLVTFQPSTPFAATAPDTFGAFEGDGARFVGTYRFVYNSRSQPLPVAGQQFAAITGIATLPYGGGIAARTAGDFVPVPSGADMGASDGGVSDGGASDMAAAPTTIHQLYLTGADQQRVSLHGLVVTGPAYYFDKSPSSNRCWYQAFLQDADSVSSAAPNGIRLFAQGGVCTTQDGGRCVCPAPPASGTALDALAGADGLGALVDVEGTFGIHTSSGKPASHQIAVSTLTLTGGTGVATPHVVSDLSTFAQSGQGYVDYESTLVTLQPALPFVIDAPNSFGEFHGDGAYFVGSYRGLYSPDKSDPFPASGDTFTSITGIADLSAYGGGGVAARTVDDFAQAD